MSLRQSASKLCRSPWHLLPSTSPPPSQTKDGNHTSHSYSIIHICGSYWPDSGEQQHCADEKDPSARDCVQWLLPETQFVGAWAELDTMGVDVSSENNGRVGEIKRWGCDVKDSHDCESRSDSNKVEGDREEYNQPDSVDWRLSIRIDF
jgi:hypothetical protein